MFLAATAMAQLDCFPSAQNLARLEFLNQPAYFVHRVMTLDALLLLFGLAVLLANRFPADRKNAMGHLFLSYPLERRQYILGKLLGGFCLAYLLTALFLLCNTAVYVLAAPFAIAPWEWLLPLGKALALCALPASWFTGLAAVALPAWWTSACFTRRQPCSLGGTPPRWARPRACPSACSPPGICPACCGYTLSGLGWRGEMCWPTPRSS